MIFLVSWITEKRACEKSLMKLRGWVGHNDLVAIRIPLWIHSRLSNNTHYTITK